MKSPPSTTTVIATIITTLITLLLPFSAALGTSATTLAASHGGATICGIAASHPTHSIHCWSPNSTTTTTLHPTTSFSALSGGAAALAAVASGGHSLIFWNSKFKPKRLYYNTSTSLTSITIDDKNQICSLTNNTHNSLICWRNGSSFQQPNVSSEFSSISSGSSFSCVILMQTNRVLCWSHNNENNTNSMKIQTQFENYRMLNIFAGGSHACGMNVTGFLICKGDNSSGQLNVPSNLAYEYYGLALGVNHTCGIMRVNRVVVCWGEFSSNSTNVSFESIVAGLGFTCGLRSVDFKVVCWGPRWGSKVNELPLPMILPGPCVETSCACGVYPESQSLCFGNGNVCRPCDLSVLVTASAPAPASSRMCFSKGLLVFIVVGSVGVISGICSVVYCLWFGKKKKIHNSVQPTITASTANVVQTCYSSSQFSRSSTLKRQMRRQRSGTSLIHGDYRAEEFMFSELVGATDNFSLANKIGAGSFGVVYKGKLVDGREVAIKRGEISPKMKKFLEKERAFESELAFLSRLHHKHLVRLVGYCEERDERLLVYEFMKNGALYDHLHGKHNVEKSSSVVNSWRARIKIALDAARGIEYLHSYAVPPIIHRDIKSSNILIDANWIARVSDFGLSLLWPEPDPDYSQQVKAVGTVGYIDPEYYGLNVLTAKSDVYGLGVVLLELLTGKKAIFKAGESSAELTSVVDFAVPVILAGELAKILDPRVGVPEEKEAEGLELVAYTAMHCVHLEGKDRPTMTDIVCNLERALAACDNSHGSISTSPISILSD